MSIDFTGSVSDPLGLDDIDTLTIAASGDDGTRTVVRRTLFENRVMFGSPTPGYVNTEAPTLGPGVGFDGFDPLVGATVGVSFTMLRDCRLTGMRFYKHPDLTGTVDVAMWDDAGTPLAEETTETLVADTGGWIEIPFSSPVSVTEGEVYTIGYVLPAGEEFAWSPWVWNSQDYVSYPFEVAQGAALVAAGGTATWSGTTSGNRRYYNYYADPIAEWDIEDPEYAGGSDYFEQWQTGGSRHEFPVAVFFADPPFLQEYYDDVGINTLIAGGVTDEYVEAITATGMDWIPACGPDGAQTAALVQADPELNEIVRGYLLDDEPDLRTPYDTPTELREWHTDIRLADSTRPIYLGLSYNPVKNQGFTLLPVGAHPRVPNQHWRDFAELADVLSCDFYSLAGDDSFGPSGDELSGSGPLKFGIWCYPIQIKRMMELNDRRRPVWGVVETTSAVPDAPDPADTVKAVWAQLIAGARGIILFDHRFASASVTQDFAALLNDPPMKAAVTAMIAQLQELGLALHAPEADLVTSVESSGVLATPKGGLAAGATLPIHHTSRQADGQNHVFAQAIRPGDTTGTFTVPSAAGKTIEVIDEARNVVADGSGIFTDDFDEDYAYHLYRWTP